MMTKHEIVQHIENLLAWGTARQRGVLPPTASTKLADEAIGAWFRALVAVDDMNHFCFDDNGHMVPSPSSEEVEAIIAEAEAAEEKLTTGHDHL